MYTATTCFDGNVCSLIKCRDYNITIDITLFNVGFKWVRWRGFGLCFGGVCGQMVGLAVMSIHDNPIGNVLAVSIGTSFLQFKNIIKRPLIWVPPLIASLISGILTALLSLNCTVQGASLGLTGLIGLREAMHLMSPTYWIVFILIDVVLPMGICFGMYKTMRKLNYIKSGDMYISGI